MIIIETISLLRKYIKKMKQNNKIIALVPTMGNLHDGHIRLIDLAKEYAEVLIVSIFVNPMQFDQLDDWTKYPRTLKQDYEKLKKNDVDFVFVPDKSEIFPVSLEEQTYISVPSKITTFKQDNRQQHFRGVSTIVSKLFNLVQPDIACFGEKDYQQLLLIRKIVIDMNYDIEIISAPIVRDEQGLALSSRNSYLTAEQRKIAPNLKEMIDFIGNSILSGKRDTNRIISNVNQKLNEQGFRTESIEIYDADTLLGVTNDTKRFLILVSVWLGLTRLIDNKIVTLK